MERDVKTTKSFRNDLKKYDNDSEVKATLKEVVEKLQRGKELDPKYRNHKLKNKKKTEMHYDCHIRPNVVLLYTYGKDGSLILERIGTHNRLELTECIKLSIKEDTCCVPGKIDYMGEDGWSNNVYYFGDKPKKPVNWKELMKKKKTKEVKEMKLSIKEEQEDTDKDNHYYYVMAWEHKSDKEDRPNYMKKFNIFEEADKAYNKCLKKFGKESHIILFEYIDGSRKIIKSTQEE